MFLIEPKGKGKFFDASFKRAAKNGKKLIIMDPRKQDLSRHAYRHLQFKPGKDVALLNAIIHTIIDEKLYEEQTAGRRDQKRNTGVIITTRGI